MDENTDRVRGNGSPLRRIIIQAGGKGTRLEGLTRNRPKCLVPVDNLPLIFHAFRKFPGAEFTIIADYKAQVLERYLAAFAGEYSYRIIRAPGAGTVSGIREAVAAYGEDEPFMILWCDLVLSGDFTLPEADGNYLGISGNFRCRWSYAGDKLVREPSSADGVAGLFIFKNRHELDGIPGEGALVDWLSRSGLKFRRLDLAGSREIGTLAAYDAYNGRAPRCRPFNSMEFKDDLVIKRGISEQGRRIAADEVAWYKHVKSLGYQHIPEILEYEPLVMKAVRGRNIFEHDCLTPTRKREILGKIIEALSELHALEGARPARAEDVEDNYIGKTFDRLSKIERLVPFGGREFIKINGRWCRNVFFMRDELTEAVRQVYPEKFYLIHGDCTFSNLMYDGPGGRAMLIDPRGYFGKTKLYGDVDYDWAKLYYSLNGDYDQFNRKRFTLDIRDSGVELAIRPNGWADTEDYFFESLPGTDRYKIRLLHAIIWLSLTTYAWEDYDSVCGAFYNGLLRLNEVL